MMTMMRIDAPVDLISILLLVSEWVQVSRVRDWVWSSNRSSIAFGGDGRSGASRWTSTIRLLLLWWWVTSCASNFFLFLVT